MDYMNVNAAGGYDRFNYQIPGTSYQNPGATDVKAPGLEKSEDPHEAEKKPGRKSTPQECETCKNRKYQDGSDEANVSFKAAAHVSPEAAGAAVRAHEGMHVSNAYKKAAQNNGTVVSASVQIRTSVCPECGRTYVAGGTTRSQIRYNNESNPYQQGRKAEDAANLTGQKMNLRG